jgi:prevent-host-death family protein
MKTLKTHEARAHFSEVLDEVEHGASIIIARGNKPIALLSPIQTLAARRLGYDAGLSFMISDDFDTYIPPEFDL